MALCSDCQALSPYRLLARPVHSPREENGIDPLMYLLKPTFSSLQNSAESCQLCQLILRNLGLTYDLNVIQSTEKNGLPTPVQVAANSASGNIEGEDSMNDAACFSTLWVVCGEIPNRDEELEGSSGIGLIIAAEEGRPLIHLIFQRHGLCPKPDEKQMIQQQLPETFLARFSQIMQDLLQAFVLLKTGSMHVLLYTKLAGRRTAMRTA